MPWDELDRVLIISPHPLFREGIIRLLGERVEVVGAVASWEEAQDAIRTHRPQAIIVDHENIELKEADLAPLLWPEIDSLKVIYVTLAGNEMIVHERRRVTGATENDLLCALEASTAIDRETGGGQSKVGSRTHGGNPMKRLSIPLLLTVVISIPLMALVQRINLLPTKASQQAERVDWLMRLEFTIGAVILVLCMVFFVYSLIVFRRRAGDLEDAVPVHGHTPLEVAWTIVPLAIVLTIGALNAGALVDVSKPPEKELEVKVTGFQWGWKFEYPEFGVTASNLVLPANRPVLFRVYSTDVNHSFWVPAFRLKIDALPGIENVLRITPTQMGEYKVRCAELCGTAHAYMVAPVKVVAESEFQEWVKAQAAPAAGVAEASAERGKVLAQQFGCVACHSTDGTRLVGPTWKGLFGSTRTLQDGTTVQADEDYLRTAILDPGAQVVQGFPTGVMPTTFKDQLTPEQIEDLIAYIKSLK